MPSFIEALLSDPQIPVYGGEHGFETRAGTWAPPAEISDATRAAARQALGERDRALAAKAAPAQATEWVLSLMALSAGRNVSIDDARGRAIAYASLLTDYPAALFTRESLQRAAAEFKFFPSFAELTERLDMDLRRLQRERKKLAVLADEARPQADRAGGVVRSAVRRIPDA